MNQKIKLTQRIKKTIKPAYKELFPDLIYYIKKELKECKSILDLGCGYNSVLQYVNTPIKVGVELFVPYLEQSEKKGIHHQYINKDIREVDFGPKSFDAVIMIDVLEHLTKEDGLKLIKKIEKWVKKKILILTPNGFVNQDAYDNNFLQEHKSGWNVEGFKDMGFNVYGINGLKILRGYGALMKYKPVFFWTVVSDVTQKIVYHFPKFAFHLFAVKKIK